MARFLKRCPHLKWKMKYLGKGKIYSIKGVKQEHEFQIETHFWKRLK